MRLGVPATGVDRFRHRSRIDAPLEAVVAFHSRIDGLVAVTPGWMRLRVEAVRGPDGGADPERLDAGSTIELSMRPFGVGPRQRWVSRITARAVGDRTASFRDVMVEGPFPHWVHMHRFEADGGGTWMTDVVEYALPVVPDPLTPIGRLPLQALFAHRHRRTRALLEGGS